MYQINYNSSDFNQLDDKGVRVMHEELQKLWERVESILLAIENKEEVTYAGLQIQHATFKHPTFCNTEYYHISDLLSGNIVLELHGHRDKLEVCSYQKEDYYWNSFISAANKSRCIENSIGLCKKR